MNGNTEKADKIAALYGMVWFVMIIDACFTWFLPEIIRYVIGTFFVILATLKLFQNNGIKLPSDRQSIILSVCVLTLFMILKFNIFKILIYFPLLCFILWRNSALLRMYSYFRAFVLFYALVSIFVEVLVLTRLWVQLPTLAVFPPQNGVQEVLGYNNYFYGLFSIPAANTSLTFYRACGPLMEGGHFVFFLGFVYFVEFGIYGKRNWWLIICMILTLSPNCLIFFFLTEVYSSIKNNKFRKSVIGIVGIPIVVYLLFFLSPQFVKDEVYRIILERSLESSIENMESEGMMALLDGRAGGNYSLIMYQNFLKSNLFERVFGFSNPDQVQGHMSDYRFLLMYCGYFGTLLIVWCTYCFSYVKKNVLCRVCIFAFAMALLIQRSWMFMQVYTWVMMLLVAIAIKAQYIGYKDYARITEK